MGINLRKRQRIIDTTVNLFLHSDDVRKVSVEAIAASACVSPTTVYNQFGTRDTLVIEAAKNLIRDIVERVRVILHSDMTFDDKMRAVISNKLEISSKVNDEVVYKVISQDKNIAPYLEKIYTSEVRQLWMEMLEQGKKQGFIDTSLDQEAFITYMNIIRAGFASQAGLFEHWKDNIEMIEKLTQLMFFGFLKKDIDLFD
ncbi:transcriptional regulatorTetR family [Dehalogenimonas sp. WBC-2]|nr:transcriptional regulatorTetR family [Dehalogenimonas sp. WBC-2]